MNILLTTHCNLDCGYCFAQSIRSEKAEMSLEEFKVLVSTLTPEKDPVRLMGGEPTLHSHYPEIIRMLKAQKYHVVVFTNGLHKVLRTTSPYLPDRILMNVNDWESYSRAQRAAIRKNLSFLGGRAGLGYTILETQFDLSVHRALILENHLQPVIRLGLAQPIIGGDNDYLPDSTLPEVHKRVAAWAETLANDGIRLSFDCGFMRRNFSDEEIEKLVRAHTMLRFDCTPSIDIGLGLRVMRCFAFSEFKRPGWDAFDNFQGLHAWFVRQDVLLRQSLQDDGQQLNSLNHGSCLARQWSRAEKTGMLNEINLINNVSMEMI